MRKSSLKYVLVAGLTLVTSFAFAAGGQASGNLQPAAATGAPVGALDGSGAPLKIRIGGTNGIPVDASAVALNVTAVGTQAPATGGYITVYPCGDRPNASNLNFISGQTLANSVITPMSANGDVCLYVYGIANLVVDVSGYVPAAGFATVSAANSRFLDTRPETEKVGKLDGTGTAKELQITGTAGIPAGISAVAMNVTAVDTEASDVGGYVTVYPCGERPNTSNINFVSGQTIPNSVIVPVSASGKVCFYVYGKADILADVSGYFPTGSLTSLSKPERLLDTRQSTQVGTIDGSGLAKELQVTGTFGIPTGISAVAMNVTAVNTEANDFGGYVTIYPCGTRPNTSTLNFISSQTVPNSVIAPVSGAGKICVYVYGKADILVDVSAHITSTNFTSLATPARVRDTREDPTPGPNALTYDFSDAVAVGVAANSIARASLQVAEGRRVAQDVDESNLVVINEDGTTETAAVNGSAKIANTLTSPDGSVYVLFESAANLDDNGTETCLLARIDTDTGLPTCVDPNIQQFFWDASFRPSYNDPIQFDDAGNVYYSAIIAPAGSMEFRKWDRATGEITSLLQMNDFDLTTHSDGRPNRGVTIFNFLTRANGQTFITGIADVCDFDPTNSVTTDAPIGLGEAWPVVGQARTRALNDDCYSHGYFIYMINSAGVIRKLPAGNPSQFFKVFPDGNVYGTYDGGAGGGIYRWNDVADDFETPAYSSAMFAGGRPVWQALAYHVANGKVLAIDGNGIGDPQKFGYVYPSVSTLVTSAITSQPTSITFGDYVVMSGTNSAGKNLVTGIDLSAALPTETILVGPGAARTSAQVDLDITSYDVLGDGKVALSATRVSDGAEVTGIFNFLTGELILNATGAAGAIEDISPIVNEELPG